MRLRRRSSREAPAETPATPAPTMTGRERASAKDAPEAEQAPATEHAPAGAAARSDAPVGAGERSNVPAGAAARSGRLAAVPAATPRRRTGLRRRTSNAAGATAGAIGSGVLAFARLVMAAAALIALLIALAIVLRDVDANGSNSIVEGIHKGANFFAGAFTGLIQFSGHPKRAITVDWGIALLVYLLAGAIASRFIASVGRGGLRFERRRRAVPMH